MEWIDCSHAPNRNYHHISRYKYLLFMFKILYLILLSLIVTNCSIKPVVKHHGVPFLEKKQSELVVNLNETKQFGPLEIN